MHDPLSPQRDRGIKPAGHSARRPCATGGPSLPRWAGDGARHPRGPQFATESEREVSQRLLKQRHDDWTLLAIVRLTDEEKDHEPDLFVLMPDVGVAVVEVKGGDLRAEDGDWVLGSRTGRRVVHPVDQGREGEYALRTYIERDARWEGSSRTRVRFGHAIAAPYTATSDDSETSDCLRWMISGHGNQGPSTSPTIRSTRCSRTGGGPRSSRS